jgi:hypothetical protein
MIRLNTATANQIKHDWYGDEILHLFQDSKMSSLCGARFSEANTVSLPGDGRPMCLVCAREAVRWEAEDDGRPIR